MLITTHQYLDKYPVPSKAKKLILGTIHPHFHDEFRLPFFYGNEVSLWKIFGQAFPSELSDPLSLDSITKFLDERDLALSDTIISCRRLSPTALDKDLEIISDNKERLFKAIAESDITEVICTSGFGKNNAFKIFYNQFLGLPMTAEIRRTRQAYATIPGSAKRILIRALYSPSRTAITGIGKSQGYKAVKHEMTVTQYRVSLYRSVFGEHAKLEEQ